MDHSLKTRVISMFLAVIMLIGTLPVSVFAEETETAQSEPAQETVTETTAPISESTDGIEGIEDLSVITYTVTFDSRGGSAVEAQTVDEGSMVTEPTAPTKEGCTFSGWMHEVEVEGETTLEAWNFAADVVCSDLTLIASWTEVPSEEPSEEPTEEVTYTVKHFLQDVEGDGYTEKIVEDAATYETVDAAKAAVLTETGFTVAKTEVAENVVSIYYDRITVTVTFDSNGGSDVEVQTVRYGAIAVEPAAPEYADMELVGWYNGETEWDFATPITEAVTLTAKWECDYYNLIESSKYTLVPGATEYQYVYNNDAGDRRQVVHVIEVDTKNSNVSVMPSFKNISTDVDYVDTNNWGAITVTDHAAHAENDLGKNVIGGMNVSLSWGFTHPYGLLIYEGVVLHDSRNTCEDCGSGHPGGGYLVIKKDGTAELRDPLDPIEEDDWMAQTVCFSFLVKDGKNLASTEDHTSAGAPRSVIGIKADGTLVMMMVDGRMAPYSEGFSNHEMAQMMLDLGCVDAINCDGGGSSTFMTEREGSGELTVKSRFSDGSERTTLTALLVLSNMKATGEFDHAAIETDVKLVTPGSTVTFTASGVDGAGGTAEIPSDVTWQMKDASMGTVENGVFTSNGTVGTATVQMVYGGSVVGEASVDVVIPDAISLDYPNMTAPYGKSIDIEVSATYCSSPVTLKASDLKFTLTNDSVGTIDGITFTAVSDTVENPTSDITVTLVHNDAVTAQGVISLGRGSEIVYDFESGAESISDWHLTYKEEYTPDNYYFSDQISVVSSSEGKVRNGEYALKVTADSDSVTCLNWCQTRINGLGIDLTDAVSLSFWIYIPEGSHGYEWDFGNAVPVGLGHWLKYGTGWQYFTVNVSDIGTNVTDLDQIRLYRSDTNNSTDGYWHNENPNYYADVVFYIDDITVNYSSAVDDNQAPTISNAAISYEGIDTATAMNGQTINANTVAFTAQATDNVVGLNASSVAVYVDGAAVAASCSDSGMIFTGDITLANGGHVVRFEISDKNGNETPYFEYFFTINGNSTQNTIQYVENNPNLENVCVDSVVWMDLKATAIEDVQSVTAVIDLDQVNTWELAHMELVAGFTASYSVNAETNDATITITRTGDVSVTGETVLASLPIRVWFPEFANDVVSESFTNYYRLVAVMTHVKMGRLVETDGTTVTFGSAEHMTVTEYNSTRLTNSGNKDGWHTHTAEAMEDKAPDCTRNGYTGRTFCEVCNSVVAWGTTEEATGHTYKIGEDGVLDCTCGVKFTGIWEDGKKYTDGIAQADGWVDDSYYKNGIKLTGIQKVPAPDSTDEFYYDFGEDGICDGQTKYTGLITDDSVIYYAQLGELRSGWQFINDLYYFFDEATFAAYTGVKTVGGMEYTFSDEGVLIRGAFVETEKGTKYYWAGKLYASRWIELEEGIYRTDSNGYIAYGNSPVIETSHAPCTWWHFDEETGLRTGLCHGFLYYQEKLHYCENGEIFYGAVRTENGIIFCGTNGIVTVNSKCYIGSTLDCTADLEYGYYWCNENGYIVSDGFATIDGDTYYFVNYNRAKGFTKIGEDYYFFNAGDGRMMTGTLWVSGSNSYGITAGYYTFQEDGKMFIPDLVNGEKKIIEEDGSLYFTINGVTMKGGLYELDGEYYYANNNGKLAVDTTIWVSAFNDLIDPGNGYFAFDASGRMVKTGFVTVDDASYYYDNLVRAKGFTKVGEDYYFFNAGSGKMMTGTLWVSGNNDYGITAGYYTFQENGKMFIPDLVNGEKKIVEENGSLYFTIDGVMMKSGLYEKDGEYYYATSNGQLAVDTTVWVSNLNDLIESDSGYFAFDATGKMVKTGFVIGGGETYYYNNAVRAKGFTKVGEDYYFFNASSGKMMIGTLWVSGNNEYGVAAGMYEFGSDGKMVTD